MSNTHPSTHANETNTLSLLNHPHVVQNPYLVKCILSVEHGQQSGLFGHEGDKIKTEYTFLTELFL